MLLEVEITEQDIKDGKRFNCFECPNSLAVVRAAKRKRLGIRAAVTTWNFIQMNGKTKGYVTFNVPRIVQQFIAKFDQEKTVKPIKYQLELVRC